MSCDLAWQLLAETQRDMGDIAQAFADGDATAFQPAFRRGSGVTPGEWRAQRMDTPRASGSR